MAARLKGLIDKQRADLSLASIGTHGKRLTRPRFAPYDALIADERWTIEEWHPIYDRIIGWIHRYDTNAIRH